ncbi:MAG: hypothetical protein LBP89_02665 [Helicobacteraceae bacterium]|jgi:hypothetical protein|nr:hypothetical protein [Helicobacteraceae bacterium]
MSAKKIAINVEFDKGINLRLKQLIASGTANGEKYELFNALSAGLEISRFPPRATLKKLSDFAKKLIFARG